MGHCSACGEWNTLVESRASEPKPAVLEGEAPSLIDAVDIVGATSQSTGVTELDRVLDGGLVPGSVTLIGGEPGIGKSTLVLQTLAGMGVRSLLVSAEESKEQIRLRAGRLGALKDDLYLLTESRLDQIVAHIQELTPTVVAVDSIQTIFDPDLGGIAGSVTQVRECAARFVQLAKEQNITVLLVGHVTKEGTLAGPRVLEHVVDTVLSFEGDRHQSIRILRALKHRYGTTNEIGVFEMQETGLSQVADPSQMLLSDRKPGATGSVIAPVIAGVRPLLVEIQALVADTPNPNPRRSAQGLDSSRLSMLLAILEQRGGVAAYGADVFASVAGGLDVDDTGADLATVAAVASARCNLPIKGNVVLLGELGLGGELRQAPQLDRRLAEAARLGFTEAICPASTPKRDGITVQRVDTLRDALVHLKLV